MHNNFRVLLFIVHFVLAIVLISKTWEPCHTFPTYYEFNQTMYTHSRNAFVLGSWVNVIFVLTLVEWISASFALYFMEIPNFLYSNNDEYLGLHFNVVLCCVWNIIFLIFIWMKDNDVPANNIILSVIMIVASCAVQNYMARAPDKKKEEQQPIMRNELEYQFFFKGHRAKHIEFHDRTYAYHLDQDNRGFMCRICKNGIIIPAFYMVIMALVPGSVTWAVQMVFLAHVLLALNAILRELSDCKCQRRMHGLSCLILLIICIALIFVPNYGILFASNSPVPMYVRILTFLLVLVWIIFIVFFNMQLDHKTRHDVHDWLWALGTVLYVLVIYSQICKSC